MRVWTLGSRVRLVSHDKPNANSPLPQDNKHASRVRRTLVSAAWGLMRWMQ